MVTTALVQGAAVLTVTVAERLSTDPKALLTRTQYEVVAVNEGVVNEASLVPTGLLVSPAVPWYHW
jgi:hypothetical protein